MRLLCSVEGMRVSLFLGGGSIVERIRLVELRSESVFFVGFFVSGALDFEDPSMPSIN